MNKNISDQLVEILVEAGIQRIYAVTGDSLNHVNAAVHRNGKIKWIHVRHEETAAFAAGAEAQLNGLACCAGSSGPGHVHLINGLYDAHRSSPSVLAMPPKLEFDKMKGLTLYIGKMMLSGRMDEVFNIISSNNKHLSEVLWIG